MIVNEDFVKKLDVKKDKIAEAQEKLDALEAVVVVKDKDHDKIMEAKEALEAVWNPLISEFYADTNNEEGKTEETKSEEEAKSEEVKE